MKIKNCSFCTILLFLLSSCAVVKSPAPDGAKVVPVASTVNVRVGIESTLCNPFASVAPPVAELRTVNSSLIAK